MKKEKMEQPVLVLMSETFLLQNKVIIFKNPNLFFC